MCWWRPPTPTRPAEIAELEERYCGRVEVLERMATVSTSARLRRIQLGLPEPWDPTRREPAQASPAVREAGTALPAGDPRRVRGLPAPARRRGRDPAPGRRVRRGLSRAWPRTSGPCRAARAARLPPAGRPARQIRVIEPARPARRGHRRRPGAARRGDHPGPRGRYDLGDGRTWSSTGRSCAGTGTGPPPRRPVSFDGEIAAAELPRELLGRAQALAGRSSDWWRQVGAVAAREGELLGCAWNQHRPTEYAPYLDGDPRDDSSAASGPTCPPRSTPRRPWSPARPGTGQPGRRRPVRHDVPVPGLRPAGRRGRVRPVLLRRAVLGARRRAVLRARGVS